MTEGSRLLKKALSEWGAKATLARELGVSNQTIWAWRRGTYRPSPPHILRLEELYGIDAGAWLRPSKEAA